MKQTLKLDLNYIRQWAEYRAPFMTGKFNTLNLMTALQPIYSLAHKRVVGHEALVRIQDKGGAPVSPAILFDQERSAVEVIHLDRLCRFIHIHNYRIINTSILKQPPPGGFQKRIALQRNKFQATYPNIPNTV